MGVCGPGNKLSSNIKRRTRETKKVGVCGPGNKLTSDTKKDLRVNEDRVSVKQEKHTHKN